ncbi:Ig-like domain-containing protein, partial [Endozoicomonas sp. SESOKO1]|uniref:Ig-like domain-containing protein n=1 Tax=Endozoicomonas sp. SESOKO1 TaxID=2828742 RepID=UPI0021472356
MNSNSMPIIGYVTDTTKSIEAVDSNGNIIIKNVGDPIYLNEVINNESGAAVVISLLNGQTLTIPIAQQMVMGPELINSVDPEDSEEEDDQEESDQEESDQEESDQEESGQEINDQKKNDLEKSDQEINIQENGDQIEEINQISDSPENQSNDDDSSQRTPDQPIISNVESRVISRTPAIEQESNQNPEPQSGSNEPSQQVNNLISQLSNNPLISPVIAPVSAPVSAPVIENQNFNVNENVPEDGSTVIGQVSASDSGDITFAITQGNEDNTFAIDPATGELLVTGPLNHASRDSYSLTVEVTNQAGLSKNVSINISVNDINEAPEARDDVDDSHENHVLTIDVLANDVDPDLGDSPANFSLNSAEIVDNLGNVINGQGSVTIVDNRLQFAPGADFDHLATGESAVITIHYNMSDDGGMTSDAITTITVTGTNDAPVATADIDTTWENNSVVVDVVANDSDLDGNSMLSVSAASIAT